MARITDDKWAREAFIKFHPSPELLEHPRLSADKTRDIVAYLLTVPGPAPGFPDTRRTGFPEADTTSAPTRPSKPSDAGGS